jgi:hypothetical protein
MIVTIFNSDIYVSELDLSFDSTSPMRSNVVKISVSDYKNNIIHI